MYEYEEEGKITFVIMPFDSQKDSVLLVPMGKPSDQCHKQNEWIQNYIDTTRLSDKEASAFGLFTRKFFAWILLEIPFNEGTKNAM